MREVVVTGEKQDEGGGGVEEHSKGGGGVVHVCVEDSRKWRGISGPACTSTYLKQKERRVRLLGMDSKHLV